MVSSVDRKNQKNNSKNNAQGNGHRGKVIRKQRKHCHAQKNQGHEQTPKKSKIQFFHYLF
jgi:hypothetical protein